MISEERLTSEARGFIPYWRRLVIVTVTIVLLFVVGCGMRPAGNGKLAMFWREAVAYTCTDNNLKSTHLQRIQLNSFWIRESEFKLSLHTENSVWLNLNWRKWNSNLSLHSEDSIQFILNSRKWNLIYNISSLCLDGGISKYEVRMMYLVSFE